MVEGSLFSLMNCFSTPTEVLLCLNLEPLEPWLPSVPHKSGQNENQELI